MTEVWDMYSDVEKLAYLDGFSDALSRMATEPGNSVFWWNWVKEKKQELINDVLAKAVKNELLS